mmetsp:Transcript_11789/g.15390  ORF Transcript_11789/g.15390 Transcript_11789/m.15390 type:complete len:236 (+) Transcript_11789:54-761(+)
MGILQSQHLNDDVKDVPVYNIYADSPKEEIKSEENELHPVNSKSYAKSESLSTCGICLWVDDRNKEVQMPCCGRDGSTIWYCKDCIKLLCAQSPGGIAHCPTCSGKIVLKGDKAEVPKDQATSKCGMCCQQRVIFKKQLCNACFLGSNNPLKYECDRCHQVQRIPHPMYRYQQSSTTFGGATWACHQRCGDYTHWRVVPSDVSRVPADDAPESWGLQAQLIQNVREQRQQSRRSI